MKSKEIDKGCSILNAIDEKANPYGVILSEVELDTIYRDLTRLDNMTNALLYGKTGWKQQAQAAFATAAELVGVSVAGFVLHRFVGASTDAALICGLALLVLWKLNLLLTHEKIHDTHARRTREDEKERKERARYFKDMGTKDLSLEE